MPRKGPAPKRPVIADPVYGSPLVSQLVSKILLDGKKSVAQSIVYDALEGTRVKTGTDPVATLKKALDNVKPSIEVKSRRVGGATYQVPIEVKPNRQNTLALRWLVSFSRARREKKVPTLDQVHRVLATMPAATVLERRDRALVAFTALTGARVAALASFRLEHIDLAAGVVHQD